jgi:putative FmdB family regulatory protein
MPIYEYQCRCGNLIEKFHKPRRVPNKARCSCGWQAKRVLSLGAIQCDSVNDVKWLPSASQVMQKHGEAPLRSRGEYNKYLKDNNIVCKG